MLYGNNQYCMVHLMDIKQLKFLTALDEARHFGRAASLCHITQPTLSMRLRSLEQELGLSLGMV